MMWEEQGHTWVRFVYFAERYPAYKGMTVRPSRICVECGVVRWSALKHTHRARELPSLCGEAYLPQGQIPQWGQDSLVEVPVPDCVRQEGSLRGPLDSLRLLGTQYLELRKQIEDAEDAAHDCISEGQEVSSSILLDSVKASGKATRAAQRAWRKA